MGIMASRGNYKTVDYYQEKSNGVVDGFEAISDEGMYYFTCNKNAKVFIISEGYTSTSARNRGMQSVAKNLMLATQYHFENLSKNQFYFILKAGNNQEIAKSKIFETEEAMHTFIGWIIGKRFSANLISEEDIDQNISVLNNGKDPVLMGIYSDQIDYFIFKGTNGKQYFSFKNKAGKTLLLNTNVRGYDNIETVNKILSEVLHFASNINNYDFKLTKNGKYYFYLKNIQSSNIAKSTFFATEDEMKEVIQMLTLGNKDVTTTSKNNNIQKQVGVKSDLFSEIDNNKKVDIAAEPKEQTLFVNTTQNIKKEISEKPIEQKQEIIEDKVPSDEDEFTALLKQQQQAELEVRLKREKEENDRKAQQNQFAKANAAVLRKHKQEQSIELDDKIKQDDLDKASKVVNASAIKKPELKKAALPSNKEEKANKPNLAISKTAKPIQSNNEVKSEAKKAIKEKSPELVKVNKENKVAKKPKKEIEKKQKVEKQIKPEKVKPANVLPNKKTVKTKTVTKNVNPAKTEKKPKAKEEKEYDPEIEKAKIAAQARFDELKKAAKVRKHKEKEEEELSESILESVDAKNETQNYDWWTKKEDSTNVDVLLNSDTEDDREPIELIKMLKPALIGLLVVAMIFVGFRSFKSSNSKKAAVINTNDKQLKDATAINTASTSVEKKYYNTTLPENFANVEKGSIEWHLINCIVNENCPQKQSFQWVETNFQSNTTYLSANALQSLDEVAKIMKEYTDIRLDILGHISNKEKDNFTSGKSLSEQRAKQVKDLLVERGVSADRLSYKGLAKTKPIQAGNSLTAQHQNKRIELILFKNRQSL